MTAEPIQDPRTLAEIRAAFDVALTAVIDYAGQTTTRLRADIARLETANARLVDERKKYLAEAP